MESARSRKLVYNRYNYDWGDDSQRSCTSRWWYQRQVVHRCGIKRVILPERNKKDLAEVPSVVIANLEKPMQ
ncbi:hypothetical protein Dimus_005262 [Dionaea muscipula]